MFEKGQEVYIKPNTTHNHDPFSPDTQVEGNRVATFVRTMAGNEYAIVEVSHGQVRVRVEDLESENV